MSARRAIARWSLRLFRREWRQQVLVLALLTVAVAAAVLGTTMVYNAVPSREAEFGTADFRVNVGARDPQLVNDAIASIRQRFDEVVVVSRSSTAVPGSVERVEVRAQDPEAPIGRPMVALLRGRYPAAADEVAITDGAAKLLRVRLGSTFAADGRARRIVGLVENPADFDDEFILVRPEHADARASATVLVRGSGADIEDLLGRPDSATLLRTGAAIQVTTRGETEKGTAAAIVLGLATVVLLLVALVAAAGFVVVAQRRLRQLGMLAAVGATERHLRLVVVANGFAVGLIAAVVGTTSGVLVWLGVAPWLEGAAGHRIDRWDVPLPIVAAGIVLAVVTASAAAWWPARSVSRVPVTEALSARPPRPKLARRSVIAASASLIAGFGLVAAGVDTSDGDTNALLFIGGLIAVTVGVLFISPIAVRALARGATRLPISGRLALRDLGRYQARSGAALAAISLGLGIAMAIVVIAAASADGATEGNLPANQMLVRVGDRYGDVPVAEQSPADLARFDGAVNGLATRAGARTTTALDVAVGPETANAIETSKGPIVATTGGAKRGVERPPVIVVRRLGVPRDGRASYRFVSLAYVATPAVLAHNGLAAGDLDPRDDLLTTQPGALFFQSHSERPQAVRARRIDAPTYSSAPSALITPAALERHGWQAIRAGWLLESRGAFTDEQVAAARDLAAEAGLTVEVRESQGGLGRLRNGATAAGILLALGILAMTVGLIRGEAAADVRTLTATGATGGVRRALTAVTAGALAACGAVIAIGGAYVVLIAAYLDDLADLGNVPVAHLSATAFGLPVAAALAGWLLAARPPDSIARQPVLE